MRGAHPPLEEPCLARFKAAILTLSDISLMVLPIVAISLAYFGVEQAVCLWTIKREFTEAVFGTIRHLLWGGHGYLRSSRSTRQ